MSMETVTMVVHCFYSNEGVMKSINELYDWKASSSLIVKDFRFHIYKFGLCEKQRSDIVKLCFKRHSTFEEMLREHYSIYVCLLHV